MTSQCILCVPREGDEGHAPEPGWRCCWRARDRMAAALRDIPVLVDELSGLGYVERDTREGTRAVRVPDVADPEGKRTVIVRVPAMADPAANLWPAGPVNGVRSGPRVGGSTDRPVPIRIDPTDLLAPARPASLAVADTGLYASDQVGHLAVATELEFWARDWADLRGERCPYPTVAVLAPWLLDRLDWACATHRALDEFAGKLTRLRTVLTAATGRLPARPQPVDRPCPSCGLWSLYHAPDGRYIECGACNRALTDDEYRHHLEDVIKTNWHRADEVPAPLSTPLWVRDDAAGKVVLGLADGVHWRSWAGVVLTEVSYWAEVGFPADPGPRKEEDAA